ncbi:MAG: hypothetical protein B6242_00105 [Anaerolineaceae bacterium 4572_78]|nr:MAG: hypothetical protein B6242_00105 [Anaerolineaceae bacterium 4572_78]
MEVTITELKPLSKEHYVTDDSSRVEFDFRCKIEGRHVIVDMQQWYKSDIVQRFYLYHALNTGLQLETLPEKRLIFDKETQLLKQVKDYRYVEPVLTLIWLVSETLGFEDNYVSFTMAPELVLNFLKNEHLWHNTEIKDLLTERKHILSLVNNTTKYLDFLSQNRLIFLIQRNIVKHQKGMVYERWFHFAEKSRNLENVESDFDEFRNDTIFDEMMRRLSKKGLADEDLVYIASESEVRAEMARWEQGYFEDGYRDGYNSGQIKGHAEGHVKGEHNKAIQIADSLRKRCMSLDEIADITGLSPTEIMA